ncbi:hypothetical protein [Halalkalibacter krulwichiae]|uniref:Uncharacterized protein n=1 Tax=Halalkalibacter krulwichiae TaxID=199441 RepID=A0A1X9MMH6_9BACI|nr:hypothetical protein [Halalkalibacter krulwichiae]ARK32362.1 hypothetical protein BkAM31D_22270 [Halalkalibacter krulwichiae]
MASRRHVYFNLIMIIVPWLSVLFLGRRTFKRYSLSSAIIGVYEMISHMVGQKRKWWVFYDRPRNFLRDELPFDIGPYMPLSMWILKLSYGNFKKFALMNALANGFFAFLFMPFLKRIGIIRLNRLSYLQFFVYIHYKAYLLYGVQYLIEKVNRKRSSLAVENR